MSKDINPKQRTIAETIVNPEKKSPVEEQKPKEYILELDGQKYSLDDKTLDTLQKAAEKYSSRYLKKKDKENYDKYVIDAIKDIRNGSYSGVTGKVNKNIFGYYKGNKEHTVFDNQLLKVLRASSNQSTTPTITGEGISSVISSNPFQYNKEYQEALDKKKNQFDFWQYLVDKNYVSNKDNSTITNYFKDQTDDYKLQVVKNAINDQANKLNIKEIPKITLENAADIAQRFGIPSDVIKGFLDIGKITTNPNPDPNPDPNSYGLPAGFTMVAGAPTDDNYYLVQDQNGNRQLLTKDKSGNWQLVSYSGTNNVLLTNQIIDRGHTKPIYYVDNKGTLQFGYYGQNDFDEGHISALNKFYNSLTPFEYHQYKNGTIIDKDGNPTDIKGINNFTKKNEGRVYDLTNHFNQKGSNSLQGKHLLLTESSYTDLFQRFRNTNALLIDENGKPINVTLNIDDSDRVTMTMGDKQIDLGYFNASTSGGTFNWLNQSAGSSKAAFQALLQDEDVQNEMKLDKNILTMSQIDDDTAAIRGRQGEWWDWLFSSNANTSASSNEYEFLKDENGNIDGKKLSNIYYGIMLANKNTKDYTNKDHYKFSRYATFVVNMINNLFNGDVNAFLQQAGIPNENDEGFLNTLYKILKRDSSVTLSNKKGGVLKYQLGGVNQELNQKEIEKLVAIRNQNKAYELAAKEKEKERQNATARVGGDATGARDWDAHDYTQLASAGLATIAMTGGVVGAVAQGAATVIDLINDITNERVSKADVWKNLGMNIGFTCLALVPGLGSLKLAQAAGKGVKIATKAGKSIKTIANAADTTQEVKAAANLLTKGIDSAKDVLKNKGLVEKGLQHIGSAVKGTANFAGKAMGAYGTVSGAISGVNIVKDVANGEGASIDDIESVMYSIPATRNIFKSFTDKQFLKRVTKRAAVQNEAKTISKEIEIGGKKFNIDFKAGSSKDDIKELVKQKGTNLATELESQISALPQHSVGKGKIKKLVYDNPAEYDRLSKELEDAKKIASGENIDNVVKDLWSFKTRAQSGYESLKTSSKNKWNDWTNPWGEGRVLKSEKELQELGLGVLERRGLKLAEKYGFAQDLSGNNTFNTTKILENLSKSSYNFGNPNRDTRAYMRGIAYKNGGRLENLRKIVKCEEGNKLEEAIKLGYNTKKEAENAITSNDGKVENYDIEEGPSGMFVIKKKHTPPANGGNPDPGNQGGGNKEDTNEDPKGNIIKIGPGLFFDAFEPEELDKKQKELDLYPLLSGTSYFTNMLGNLQAFNDKMSGIKPVYKTPVLKYNQTIDGFDERNATLHELAEARRQAEEANKTSDQALNNATNLAIIANELNQKNKLATRAAAIEEQSRAVQDQNEYANRVASLQAKETNDLMDSNVAEQRANIRAQYDQASASNFDRLFRENAQHFYAQANRNWEHEKEQIMSETNIEYETKNTLAYNTYVESLKRLNEIYDAKVSEIQAHEVTQEMKNEELKKLQKWHENEELRITNAYTKALNDNKNEYIRKGYSIRKAPLPGEISYSYTPRSSSDEDVSLIVSNKKGGSLTFVERRELERMKQAYKKLQKDAELIHKSVKESNKQINNVLSSLEKERLLLMHKYYEIGRK